MRRCHNCFRWNKDAEPLCIYCTQSLAGAESIAWLDPDDHEEEDWAAVWAVRRKLLARKLLAASLVYIAAIDFTAMVPGLVFNGLLLGFSLSAAGVALGVTRWRWGQLRVTFLQSGASAAILLSAGSFHFLTPFMLLAHVVFPGLLCLWVEGLCEMN